MKRNILVVDDEPPLRKMVAFALERAGFDCAVAADTREAKLCIADHIPDLILLDWMLPEVSGVEFARMLKRDEVTREIPIIMLTARTEERDKVRGFDAGVDDYVTKPFSPRELVARINAVLRRTLPDGLGETLEASGLSLNTAAHEVRANGKPVEVAPKELRLLSFLLTHKDKVYSRSQLLDHVWGQSADIEERTVDVHIRRLRKALTPSGHDRLIQTVRGVGYRFSIKSRT
ncbi:MAG: phosphate regulon transcriptional regulatory protein PhoB [Gammaproteobacteria bacterium]|nr:MAG: phosphate regulon transcriptional regulatory protein PhoB [Gammaproteobacteria bacterium]